ncbi:hypothetical protein JCM12141A_14480 [Mycolicibacterium hodleri]
MVADRHDDLRAGLGKSAGQVQSKPVAGPGDDGQPPGQVRYVYFVWAHALIRHVAGGDSQGQKIRG